MSQAVTSETGQSPELLARYEALLKAQPSLRIRDAADRLGVSEAELVAGRCGAGVTRLDGRWGEMLRAFPGLGPVMVLTRNDYAVHEKTGPFENVELFEMRGLVTGTQIDLRINLAQWAFGYAVTAETGGGTRHSLQFFDGEGTAVFKLFLIADSDRDAFARLVDGHVAEDQRPGEAAIARPAPARETTLSAAPVDAQALRRDWLALQDVHEFHGLLRRFGIDRVSAYRAIGADLAEPVAPGSFRAALEQAAGEGLPIMVFVGSPGVVQIHTGPVRRLEPRGPWFNVLDEDFNLHLREDGIASAWVVRKPTSEGVISSLEIFDDRDRQIAWMFGQRERGAEERAEWRALLARLPRL